MRRVAASSLVLTVFVACARLPSIEAGICGNGVIEDGEDCDTFAPNDDSRCREPGAVGECMLDCRDLRDGTRAECPDGWGCDPEGICRAPTGDFDPPRRTPRLAAWSLLSGDFDGDGRVDVVARDLPDLVGRAHTRIVYFDERAQVESTSEFGKLVLAPTVADVSNDRRSDLLFSDARLGALLGREDRQLVPETFSSFQLPRPRVLPVYPESIRGLTGFLVLTSRDGRTEWLVPEPNGLRRVAHSDGEEPLLGSASIGNLFEDESNSPCAEVAFAEPDGRQLWIADPCRVDPDSGYVSWRDELELHSVELEPAATIDTAPLVVDLNLDGHLDVAFSASETMYAAYGDGGSLTVAEPYLLHWVGPDGEAYDPIPMPLAAADVTGDGAVDFVLSDQLLISDVVPGQALPTYSSQFGNYGAPWTTAAIADFNQNGELDIVAASDGSLGIKFFNGFGTKHLTESELVTDGPVQQLTVGDFDGDSIVDLAWIEAGVNDDDQDRLLVAYGEVSRVPTAGSEVARVNDVGQLAAFAESGSAGIAVASETDATGQSSGSLTLLDADSDRQPFAPLQLTTFAEDGGVRTYLVLGLTAGKLFDPDHQDVVALSAIETPDAPLTPWLLRDFSRAALPQRVDMTLPEVVDPRLSPSTTAIGFSLHLATASADLDGDGLDEVVFASAASRGDGCAVLVVSGGSDDTPLVLRDSVIIDEPCRRPQVSIADIDDDGALDIALLGADGEDIHSMFCFWNDGKGGFAESARTRVTPNDQSPLAFTALPRTATRRSGFAYVTDDGAHFVGELGSRKFSLPQRLLKQGNTTGITSADVDGDGVLDLAVAASGELIILRSRLKGEP